VSYRSHRPGQWQYGWHDGTQLLLVAMQSSRRIVVATVSQVSGSLPHDGAADIAGALGPPRSDQMVILVELVRPGTGGRLTLPG
jgi:hypothetical protein